MRSRSHQKGYETGWRAFQNWCRIRGVVPLPGSAASVAAFLAAMAERGLRPNVSRMVRSCAALSSLTGIDCCRTDAAIVKTTMKGLRLALGRPYPRGRAVQDRVACDLFQESG